MNLMNLVQEKVQGIQDFRDQNNAMKKVCNKMELHFGRCKSDNKAVIARKGMKDPTQEQLNKELDIIKEECHTIIFMYEVDKYKYSKEWHGAEKEKPFQKTNEEAWDTLRGWKNWYRYRDNHICYANHGIAFMTTGSEEEK